MNFHWVELRLGLDNTTLSSRESAIFSDQNGMTDFRVSITISSSSLRLANLHAMERLYGRTLIDFQDWLIEAQWINENIQNHYSRCSAHFFKFLHYKYPSFMYHNPFRKLMTRKSLHNPSSFHKILSFHSPNR